HRRRTRPRRASRRALAPARRCPDRRHRSRRGEAMTTAMRQRATNTLVDLFYDDERVALVLADISLDLLAPALQHDPRRAVNVGIMEQAAVGVAAGFALEGFHPVVHTIAPFLAERPLEQIKLDFGYQQLGGLFLSVGGSYDYGASGMTHHSPGDVA